MFDCSIKGQNIHLAKSLLDFASCHMKFAKIMKTGKIRQPNTLQKICNLNFFFMCCEKKSLISRNKEIFNILILF